jgi:5-formyltetrahydrofolate cyclo-ligase
MKHYLRKVLINTRKNLPQDYVYLAREQIFSRFKEFLMQYNFKVIATYHPIIFELDISHITQFLYSSEIEIALPYLQDKVLAFRKWDKNSKLIYNNKFYQPTSSAPILSPDLIIVPSVGFDRRGFRLGYGFGFYDKILPLYPNSHKICLAYSIQEIEEIVVEAYDFPVNTIITEKESITCRK